MEGVEAVQWESLRWDEVQEVQEVQGVVERRMERLCSPPSSGCG